MLEKLADGLDDLSKLSEVLLGAAKDTERDLGTFESEIKNLNEKVASLLKTVRDDNGNSLITKVALLEIRVKDLEKWREKYDDKTDDTQRGINSVNTDIATVIKDIEDLKNKYKGIDELKKEKELVKYKSSISVKENRQKELFKIVILILTMSVSSGITWFVTSYLNTPRKTPPVQQFDEVPS